VKIKILEHKQWMRRTVEGLRVLKERGVTHIRIKPSKGFKYDWSQVEINHAIKELKKDEK